MAIVLFACGVVLLLYVSSAEGRAEDANVVLAGSLMLGLGAVILISYAILAFAERSGVREALERPVLPDDHPVARTGRGVFKLNHALNVATFLFIVVTAAIAAFHEPLTARILAATALLVLLIGLGGRIWRWRHDDSDQSDPPC